MNRRRQQAGGECLRTVTHAQTDRQPENIMHPVKPTGLATTYYSNRIFYKLSCLKCIHYYSKILLICIEVNDYYSISPRTQSAAAL